MDERSGPSAHHKTVKRKVAERTIKSGMPPGTVVHTGTPKEHAVRMRIMDYNADRLEEKEAQTVEECFTYFESASTSWINIDGIHDTEIIARIGEHYKLHPLLLEDIANPNQRPKIEDFDDYIFLVMRMLTYEKGAIKGEQVSLVLGKNFLISFQEEPDSDVFDAIRERLRQSKGRLREQGADYLMYSLIDAIVDNYFVILEHVGDSLEVIEEELVKSPDRETLTKIHEHKTQMLHLRKSIWPLRDVLSLLDRDDSPLIRPQTRIYIRDAYDHLLRIIDTSETFRDMISGMLDIYLSSMSNKMNEVMKVLTIISTIFMPLTFLAGVYGMNFRHMPELDWWWYYPLLLIVMAIVALAMIYYFFRRGWVGGDGQQPRQNKI